MRANRSRPTVVEYDDGHSVQASVARGSLESASAPALAPISDPLMSSSVDEQAHWLEDYALFRALKDRYKGAYYLEWPAELVRRDPAALARGRRELADPIDLVRFAQFLLFRQGARLEEHARDKGVRLIGDLPFFVSPDSSDVWANPELFLLDEGVPGRRFVAGVPPDYFSAEGQLWGNPVYDWDALASDRLSLVHRPTARPAGPRGRDPAGSFPRLRGRLARAGGGADGTDRANGCRGPGAEFFTAVEKDLGGLPLIAEDLGLITPDVYRAARSVPAARDEGPPVRLRRPMRTTRTCPTTTVPTPSSTRAPTTMTRRAAGIEELPDKQRAERVALSGAPAGDRCRGGASADAGGVVVRRPRWRWLRFRTCSTWATRPG